MTTQRTPYDAKFRGIRKGTPQNPNPTYMNLLGLREGYLRAKNEAAPLLEAAKIALVVIFEGSAALRAEAQGKLERAIAAYEGSVGGIT